MDLVQSNMRKHNDGCTCFPDEFVKHGWEWDVVRNQCVCDLCAGGCCKTNPSCYDCFLCDEKIDYRKEKEFG
jgi:hypothetical protein